MKQLAIIAILAIALIACAPVMPAQNNNAEQNTTNETTEEPIQIEAPEPAAPETNETAEEPIEVANKSDLPKKEVVEGELVDFPNLKAVDPDGDPITYTFTSPLNPEGKWQTEEGDAGEHVITITASDGSNVVSQQVLIVVLPKNKPPMIELEEPVTAQEGTTFTIQPTVTDLEGDEVTITYSGWMTSATREIGYDESGNHKIVITAEDGKSKSTKEVIISVENVNRAPEFSSITPQTIKEGQKVTVKPSAKDPDGDSVEYVFDFPLDETGAWQTEIGDAGEYEILVTATDGDQMSEQVFMLVVEAVNKAPVIELESPVLAQESETVQLNPVITDPEGDEVRVSYSGWMTSNTKATGYDDSGNHKVTIVARDTAGNEARLEIIVSVQDVNRPPVFGAGSFN